MQLIGFYISVAFLAGLFLMIYQFTVILLLIGTLFNHKVRSEAYNFLYVFNTMVAWSSLFSVFAYVMELFMAWYGQNPYEWYAFKSGQPDGYRLLYSTLALLSFLIGFLLFFRKLRIKRWLTLLFFISNLGLLFERMVIIITGLYRDHIPTSWSPYSGHTYSSIYSFVIILFLLVVIYLWAKKKARLPFPSVFLK